MEISYDEVEDILLIHLSHDPIIRDILYGWHVNVGMTATGIGQITILEAKANSMLPVQLYSSQSYQQDFN